MLGLSAFAALCLATSHFCQLAQAQVVDYNETILASVIIVRTGDHTPLFLGNEPSKLISSGAQQLYNAGGFFRSRYISNTDNATISSRTAAPISGLATDLLDNSQLFFLANENNVMLPAAQAFAQGLYPPAPLSSPDAGPLLDSSSILANKSYISSPLSNYQYVSIASTNDNDPTSIVTSGSNNCPAWNSATSSYSSSAAFTSLSNSSHGLYVVVGSGLLNGVLDTTQWSYDNAYAIYDYVLYLANHNATAAAFINSTTYGPTRGSGGSPNILAQLRNLASQQLWSLNNDNWAAPRGGNGAGSDSILQIAGSTVAMSVLEILEETVESQGSIDQKLSVFVGDYEPFLGFASASQLASRMPTFQGLPGYGASMVWELYSKTNGSNGASSTFPSSDDLWVRFLFRNGSDNLDPNNNDLISYPLFNRDPDQTEIQWIDFESLMSDIAVGGVYDWCDRCDARTLFCIALNSLKFGGYGNGNSLSNAAAGAIGAGTTIGVLLITALFAALIGGVRLRTVPAPLTATMGRLRRNRSTRVTNRAGPSATGVGDSPSQDNKHGSLQSAVTAVDEPQRESEQVGIVERAKAESWEMTSMRRLSNGDDHRDKLDEMGKPVEAVERV